MINNQSFCSIGIVYGIRANGLLNRTWSVFDVAGKQLEDIRLGEGVGVCIHRHMQQIDPQDFACVWLLLCNLL